VSQSAVGRGVPGISATVPVTIGEGSITGGWGGDFEIDYWSLLPAGDLFGSCVYEYGTVLYRLYRYRRYMYMCSCTGTGSTRSTVVPYSTSRAVHVQYRGC
jgi:hypothetical protein